MFVISAGLYTGYSQHIQMALQNDQSGCDTQLRNYLQSYKYFEDKLKGPDLINIQNLFQFDTTMAKSIDQFIFQMKANWTNVTSREPLVIGVHIRRGINLRK